MHPHPPKKSRSTTDQQNSSSVRSRKIKFPGKGELLKKPEPERKDRNPRIPHPTKKQNTVENVISGKVKSPVSCVVKNYQRSNSFSRYKPLPAIKLNEEKDQSNALSVLRKSHSAPGKPNKNMRKSASSNKRIVFPNGTLEENVCEGVTHDNVLNSMKKMKLTLDGTNASTNSIPHLERLNDNTSAPPYPINLIIRTLTGDKIHHTFSSQNTALDIFSFLSQYLKTSIDTKQHILYTSEVPKKQLDDVNLCLEKLGIRDRTVLLLDIR